MLTIYHFQAASRQGAWLAAESLGQAACELIGPGDQLWIDLSDPSLAEEEQVFQKFLPIHPLSLEDINKLRREQGSRPHLPKAEEFSDYLFVIMNPLSTSFLAALQSDSASHEGPVATQLSVVLTGQILITHHYESVLGVDDLHEYLKRHGNQAERGPDFLFHLVLDSIVDQYAPTLEDLENRLDSIEETVFKDPDPTLLPRLLRLKRYIILLRKNLHYEREVLARLTRGEFALIEERETVYYRNVYDHLVRFAELIESSREMVSDLMQSHLASTSNRLSIVMKALTLISTIILPMSLVSGVYGMNFHKMPEIEWQYGYAWALGLMFLAAGLVLSFYRWKRWI